MTKEKIVERAVRIVSSYPQITTLGGGETLTKTSASEYYDMLLPTLMEDFIYGFGIAAYVLSNPVTLEGDQRLTDSNYKYYSLPSGEKHIFTLCRADQMPAIRSLIGRKGLRTLPSYSYTLVPDRVDMKLQVHQPFENMAIGYIQSSPNPAIMTATFRYYLSHMIAYKLALKNEQQLDVARMIALEARVAKLRAQKFSLDNTNHFEYIQAGLASAPLDPIPPREYPKSDDSYIRGLS